MLTPEEIVDNLRQLSTDWDEGKFANEEELAASIEGWKPTILGAADLIELRVMGKLQRTS